MDETYDPVHILSDDEAWAFFRSRTYGRLAYHVASEVDIAPMNYVATPDGLVFRTAPGNKLFGVIVGKTVAFEVDQVDEDTATSVVARGIARHLTVEAAEAAEALPLRPWVPTDKTELVAVHLTEITGRRFDLLRSDGTQTPASTEPSG